jgi:hypothetical protein
MAIKMRGKPIRGRQERLTQAHHNEGLLAPAVRLWRQSIAIQRVEVGASIKRSSHHLVRLPKYYHESTISRHVFL